MNCDRTGLGDRYRGTLLGLAAGDALGATAEFMSREQIRQEFGVLRDIVGGGWLNLPAGEVTDDTQMMLCIARSIAQCGEFDGKDVASRFLEWYASNPPDIGNTTRISLKYLDAGVHWREAGQRTHDIMSPKDASNGSLMRCAPVALYARSDPDANARYSAESSIITHANPLSVQSCVALNAAIAALLDDPDADPLAAAVQATDHEEVRAAVEGASSVDPDWLESSGYVLHTLHSALWAVAAHDSLEDAIVAAVNLGEDTDTTGAVAGALAGARWGMAAIPDRWLDALRRRDEIVELADRLLETSMRA